MNEQYIVLDNKTYALCVVLLARLGSDYCCNVPVILRYIEQHYPEDYYYLKNTELYSFLNYDKKE